MSDNSEVQTTERESGNVHNKYENSVHHAVNLWPLFLIAIVAASMSAVYFFAPDAKHRAQLVPVGKAYAAVGQIVNCEPITYSGNGPYRSFIRTPNDEFFSVYWRRDFQPPVFGAAIGNLKYHQCGMQDGMPVHCFDSFLVSKARVELLNLNPVMPAKKQTAHLSVVPVRAPCT